MMPDHLSKCVSDRDWRTPAAAPVPRLPAALWDAEQRTAFAAWCGAVLGARVEWGPEQGNLRRDLLVFDSVTIAAMIRGLVATFEGGPPFVRVLRCEVPSCD